MLLGPWTCGGRLTFGGMMKLLHLSALASLAVTLVLTGAASAEAKVELKDVHLCCPGCTKAVGDILKTVDGVKGECDRKAGTITLTADDNKTIQKALDALAAGGFHGDTGKDSGAKKGKVKSLTLTGVHNCCTACCKAIKEAVNKVDGVTSDTAEPKKDTFEVKGDFDAAELVKALNAAGYHVKVKK
jgi:periplasmic mercuric ion binding protein